MYHNFANTFLTISILRYNLRYKKNQLKTKPAEHKTKKPGLNQNKTDRKAKKQIYKQSKTNSKELACLSYRINKGSLAGRFSLSLPGFVLPIKHFFRQ